jgi:hypothetical protein
LGLVIEPLGKHHDRASFSSGQPDLDDWFRHRASQDEKRRVARVFVARDTEASAESAVVGFYSLSSLSLSLEDLPEEIARKLPRYDAIPAALIGRLARAERVRGQGVGELRRLRDRRGRQERACGRLLSSLWISLVSPSGATALSTHGHGGCWLCPALDAVGLAGRCEPCFPS